MAGSCSGIIKIMMMIEIRTIISEIVLVEHASNEVENIRYRPLVGLGSL